jgi:methionine--tRNA ligase beta chain
MINFEEFQKVDLRVAKVITAEKVEGSEKLLKLQVDLGPSTGSGQEKRQIVAGIAQFYKPEDLTDKEIVIVVNLEPKTVFGLESRGMLLAADDSGRPVILILDKEVPPGTKIR